MIKATDAPTEPQQQTAMINDSYESKRLAHCFRGDIFFPLVPVDTVEGAAETSVDISAVHSGHSGKAFWAKWQEIVNVYLPYVDQTPIIIVTDFVKKKYFDIIAGVVQSVDDFPCPKVAVAFEASEDTVALRTQLLRLLDVKDLKWIEAMVTDRWQQETLKLPLPLQNQRAAEPPETFRQNHYYPCLLATFGHLLTDSPRTPPNPSPGFQHTGMSFQRLPLC